MASRREVRRALLEKLADPSITRDEFDDLNQRLEALEK